MRLTLKIIIMISQQGIIRQFQSVGFLEELFPWGLRGMRIVKNCFETVTYSLFPSLHR